MDEYPDSDANAHADQNTNADDNIDVDADENEHADTEQDEHADSNPDPHAYADAKRDPETVGDDRGRAFVNPESQPDTALLLGLRLPIGAGLHGRWILLEQRRDRVLLQRQQLPVRGAVRTRRWPRRLLRILRDRL